jgi:hypothetical protein
MGVIEKETEDYKGEDGSKKEEVRKAPLGLTHSELG